MLRVMERFSRHFSIERHAAAVYDICVRLPLSGIFRDCDGYFDQNTN